MALCPLLWPFFQNLQILHLDMAHILIVEDESDLVDTWSYYLEQAGHKITATTEGAVGLEMAQTLDLDLILLDLRLNRSAGHKAVNGMDILRTVRETSQVPVIVTTGNFTEPVDRVMGFQQGADDYLIKGNFGVQELLVRVEYQLSHHNGDPKAGRPEVANNQVLTSGTLVVDRDRLSASLEGAKLELTPLEFRLLVLLMRNQGKNLSYEEIWKHCWDDVEVEPVSLRNNVRIQVSGLRRKIGNLGPREPRVISIRSVGYCFRG